MSSLSSADVVTVILGVGLIIIEPLLVNQVEKAKFWLKKWYHQHVRVRYWGTGTAEAGKSLERLQQGGYPRK